MRLLAFLFILGLAAPIGARAADPRELWLDDLPIMEFSEGIRPVQVKANYVKDRMRMQGREHTRGLGAQSICVLTFRLDGQARRFTALVGPDDAGNREIPLRFQVLGDRRVLFDSGELRVGDTPRPVDVDLSGVEQLGLLVTDPVGGIANKRTYCNWADARLVMEGEARPGRQPNDGKRYILTPPPAAIPRINSPRVFGATPGHPFLFTVAATGQRPLRFEAEGLPAGLSLDPATGIISGRVGTRGTSRTRLTAINALGRATQELRIEIGDTIALTPPMGWNGWNAWADRIDRAKVLASAEAMVATGLIHHGWSYINLDDTWQGVRGGPLEALQPNEKFPEFAEMVARIHALGLKVGLYSTPYVQSYAGYVGASSHFAHGGETREGMAHRAEFRRVGPYRFETNDARQMAEWGIDFLKYDWRIDVASAERMSRALRHSGRDIVFSLSNNAPFEKAADWARLANLYRTGPDIRDSWTSLYLTAFGLDHWAPFAGPGHWSDPDMMIIGNVSTGADMHPTRLTPDEQYSHVSLFCLLSAPLLIGCPLEQLDAFTLGLLTNDEMIAINQDPLGRQARRAGIRDGVEVWLKPLEDGSVAVGLFNTGDFGKTPQSYFRWANTAPARFEFRPADWGLPGIWIARDAWRQLDLGAVAAALPCSIPHHGVVVLRLSRR
ncbi:MAG: NPCBM/NEW2 domain-containing protein [Verrucomicrobia bacterium]|nr:NPCBM/NEW2 domain-containing protein [Verrucomicrobiota bacterium]